MCRLTLFCSSGRAVTVEATDVGRASEVLDPHAVVAVLGHPQSRLDPGRAGAGVRRLRPLRQRCAQLAAVDLEVGGGVDHLGGEEPGHARAAAEVRGR